jgi:hypothetical protein
MGAGSHRAQQARGAAQGAAEASINAAVAGPAGEAASRRRIHSRAAALPPAGRSARLPGPPQLYRQAGIVWRAQNNKSQRDGSRDRASLGLQQLRDWCTALQQSRSMAFRSRRPAPGHRQEPNVAPCRHAASHGAGLLQLANAAVGAADTRHCAAWGASSRTAAACCCLLSSSAWTPRMRSCSCCQPVRAPGSSMAGS